MNDLSWRARIDTVDGDTLGAGLLVTDSQVLTCAHVVQSLTRVHVTFPGTAEKLPGTVAPRGSWRQEGDAEDVAVVRLDDRPPARACTFAGLDALSSRSDRESRELIVLGFPPEHGRDGIHAVIRASADQPLRREWLQVEIADPGRQRLSEGFSGAAAYIPGTNEVVGMITDAVLDDDGRGIIGHMLPLATIRRYWEPLDDLLPLAWLPARPRQELRALISQAGVSAQLAAIFRTAFPAFRGELPEFGSIWEAIRYVGESMVEPGRQLRPFLVALSIHLDEGARHLLTDFIRRWLAAPGPAARPPDALATSIVIRMDTPTRNGRTHLDMTIEVMIEGQRVSQSPVLRIRRDQLQARVEKAVAAELHHVHGYDWMLEFAVPQTEMSHPYEDWELQEPGSAQSWPMRTVPVVVRHVDRLHSGFASDQARRRWQTVRGRAETGPQQVDNYLEYDFETFRNWLDADESLCALVYSSPPRPDWLRAALHTGIPIMLWRRRDCGAAGDAHDCAAGFFRRITEALSRVDPDELPVEVMRLRKLARSPRGGGDHHCGRHLTLFWDDPARRPEAEPPLSIGRQ
jgi:hypothetical protein